MKRVPRAAGVLVWTVGAVALHAVVPFELSRLGDRVTPQGPAMSARRGAGLLTVVAGAALMAWAMTAHYQAAPRGWALDSRLTPGSCCGAARTGSAAIRCMPEMPSSGSAGRR